MTNQPYGASMPRGNTHAGQSESGLLRPGFYRQMSAGSKSKKNPQRAAQAPRAGQPQWPAAGARGEYEYNCKGKVGKHLTDKSWIMKGLRPHTVDMTRGINRKTHTGSDQASNKIMPPRPAPAGTPPPPPPP